MSQQRYQDEDATTPAQQMVRALYDHGLSDQSIADLCASTQDTINRIRHGHQSGRNLTTRITRVYETLRRNCAEAGFDG